MGKKLYVGNLPFNTTETAVQEIFQQAGTVESAKIIMDRATGRSKGFGFVEMSSDEEAQQAIEKFNGYQVDGRSIKVSEANEKPAGDRGGFGGGGGNRGPRGGGFGGGGGGGFGGGGGNRGPRGGGNRGW